MTPEQMQQKITELEYRLNQIERVDRYVFRKPIDIPTELKIGRTATQKLSLYGVTPVVQAGAISAPSGGVTQDAQARTAINSIRTALTNIGITA